MATCKRARARTLVCLTVHSGERLQFPIFFTALLAPRTHSWLDVSDTKERQTLGRTFSVRLKTQLEREARVTAFPKATTDGRFFPETVLTIESPTQRLFRAGWECTMAMAICIK